MRSILSVSLPRKILNELKSESKKEDATISEIVRKALQDYLFKVEIERLGKKFRLQGAKKGIRFSEDEILEKVS